MEELVSIIIPLYNRKHLIRRCVDSVCAQTYKNLEIIVVDDGSTDEPDAVLAELAQDTRVKIIRKPNGGVSSARNAGLDAATGTYVQFVDSDDVIVPYAVEIIVREMESHGVDSVSFAFFDAAQESPPYPADVHGTMARGADCVKLCFLSYRQCSPVNKLFRRELLKNLRFRKDISWGEDFIFNMEYLPRCTSLRELDIALYGVQHNSEGSLNSRYDVNGFQEACAQYEACIHYLLGCVDKEMEMLMQRYLWGCYSQCVLKLCLRSHLMYREQVRVLHEWSRSSYVRWLKPEMCPKVLFCLCLCVRWFAIVPLILRMARKKNECVVGVRRLFRSKSR